MARPTNRQEWLEVFLLLVDQGKSIRHFRGRLGIKEANLKNHIEIIGSYRDELKKIHIAKKATEMRKKKKVAKPVLTRPLPRVSKSKKPKDDCGH